jgi:hypothetical protein
MNATIDLPTSPLHILSSAFTRNEHPTLGSEFAGPTPFELPEGAVLEFSGPYQMAITFNYSDRESAEASDRLASADGNVVARLAAQTKKILRIQYSGDIGQQLINHFAFDKSIALESGPAFSNREYRSFMRNAAVIESLLNAIPQGLYQELQRQVQVLKDSAHGGLIAAS